MSRKKKVDRETLLIRTAAELRALDPLVILSHGLGVETAAIWKRWYDEPATRPFTSWDRLIVITAQVGHEHKETVRLMETHQLPEMVAAGVRFVELARRGHLEEDGIVVLQDTTAPTKLHPEGVYKLFDEMQRAGTVPQYSGAHTCAMKFKAFVIESWTAWALRGETNAVHVWGYNNQELSRVANSDQHVLQHNAERTRALKGARQPIVVFGFNNQELGRAARAMEYDGPHRLTHYPLLEWQWDRQRCLEYLDKAYLGVQWIKSACGGCPFNEEAYNLTPVGIKRFRDDPEQTVTGLLSEYISLCFNPNGQLYRDRTLQSIVRDDPSLTDVWAAFQAQLETMPWGFYEVRRIFTVDTAKDAARKAAGKATKASVARAVRRLATGTRAAMEKKVNEKFFVHGGTSEGGIARSYFDHRTRDVYPTVEGFYVAAPATVADKVRGNMEVFDARYEAIKNHCPVPKNQDVADEDLFHLND